MENTFGAEKRIKATEYLFGDNFDKKILQKQKEVAEYKIKKAKEVLKELLTKPFYEMSKEEDARLNDVLKAIDFWTGILNEYNGH